MCCRVSLFVVQIAHAAQALLEQAAAAFRPELQVICPCHVLLLLLSVSASCPASSCHRLLQVSSSLHVVLLLLSVPSSPPPLLPRPSPSPLVLPLSPVSLTVFFCTCICPAVHLVFTVPSGSVDRVDAVHGCGIFSSVFPPPHLICHRLSSLRSPRLITLTQLNHPNPLIADGLPPIPSASQLAGGPQELGWPAAAAKIQRHELQSCHGIPRGSPEPWLRPDRALGSPSRGCGAGRRVQQLAPIETPSQPPPPPTVSAYAYSEPDTAARRPQQVRSAACTARRSIAGIGLLLASI